MFLVIKNKKGETELITPPLDGKIYNLETWNV